MVNVEIVTIQVGQCGNQIGANFWQKVNEEYKLDENGSFVGNDNERFSYDYMGTYFRSESNEKNYTPRTVLVDLDRTVLDDIKQSKLKNYFDSKNFVYPNTELSTNSEIQSGENNWAKGHKTNGAKMVDRILDAVRKEAESCDCLLGFSLIHSLGGGTGSGLGTLLISKIREEYPDRMMLTNTVIPSPSPHSANVLETYNSVLSVHQLIENADLIVCYDNLALRNVYLNRLNQKSFTLDDQNSIISRCMLNQTSCMRLPHQQEADLRKMAVSLVPFPRLHFFIPFLSFSSNKGLMNVFTDTSTNILASVNFRNGKFISLANIYRGRDLSLEEVFTQTLNLQNKNSSYFVEWIPNNCVIGVCQEPEKNIQVSSTFISNTTAIQEPFKRLSENFTAMFRRKAFFHHYTAEGMDEMEFTETESNMNDLVSEYQQYQDATADQESETGDEYAQQAMNDEDA